MTDVRLKSLGGVEEVGGYVPPKCRYPCEFGYDGVLTLVLEPIDSVESRERDFVADAANEEGQDTLVSSLCPLNVLNRERLIGVLNFFHQLVKKL